MGNPAGLFGFIGWPSQVRHTNADTLQSAIITQLVRCFGEEARTPDYFHLEDWAENPFVCLLLLFLVAIALFLADSYYYGA